jgi:hypothetical protein
VHFYPRTSFLIRRKYTNKRVNNAYLEEQSDEQADPTHELVDFLCLEISEVNEHSLSR